MTVLKKFKTFIDLHLFQLNYALIIVLCRFYLFNAMKHVEEINQRGYKINKPLPGLLVYWRIMPLAERLSSKFHSYP